MSEEEGPKEQEPERFRLVGKRLPEEMREAIRELGKEMPIDFVEVQEEAGKEGGPELTVETRCGATKLEGAADKVKLSECLSSVSCAAVEKKQKEEAAPPS
jgi:hypothetical protein